MSKIETAVARFEEGCSCAKPSSPRMRKTWEWIARRR